MSGWGLFKAVSHSKIVCQLIYFFIFSLAVLILGSGSVAHKLQVTCEGSFNKNGANSFNGLFSSVCRLIVGILAQVCCCGCLQSDVDGVSMCEQTGGKMSQRMKKRPPRGMFLSQQDVVSLSSSTPQGLTRQLDSQLVSIKRQVCCVPALFKRLRSVCLCASSLFCPVDSDHQAGKQRSEGETQLRSGGVQAT